MSCVPARSRPHAHSPSGKCGTVSSGSSQRIAAPGAPGCLPRFRFPAARCSARRCFRGGDGPARRPTTAASSCSRCCGISPVPAAPPARAAPRSGPPACLPRPAARPPDPPAPRSAHPGPRKRRNPGQGVAERTQIMIIQSRPAVSKPTRQAGRQNLLKHNPSPEHAQPVQGLNAYGSLCRRRPRILFGYAVWIPWYRSSFRGRRSIQQVFRGRRLWADLEPAGPGHGLQVRARFAADRPVAGCGRKKRLDTTRPEELGRIRSL